MAEILQDPLKLVMLIILVVTEIPAAIALVWMWVRDCREARERDK